jgi:high-affinity nickel permease
MMFLPGLRHGMDADYLAAIDNLSRFEPLPGHNLHVTGILPGGTGIIVRRVT